MKNYQLLAYNDILVDLDSENGMYDQSARKVKPKKKKKQATMRKQHAHSKIEIDRERGLLDEKSSSEIEWPMQQARAQNSNRSIGHTSHEKRAYEKLA